MTWTVRACFLGLILAATSLTADDSPDALNDKEKAFVELLENAELVGNFSVNRSGPEKDGGRQVAERYGIRSVKKVKGDEWVVNARIKYGTLDVTVPVPVHMHWADDTPVLCVTDLSIPLVGDGFTSRVMFYDGMYAGTWRHGKVGGLMSGRIEKKKETGPDVTPKVGEEKEGAAQKPQP